MSSLKLTVYITNYNYGQYLELSIKSVLGQTLQNFELLIIDDGSTDDSRNILEEYSDHPKVQLIYQQNHGLNVTNNIALRLARGKYIIRLDADDYLVPEALETMVAVLENNPDVGLVFPDFIVVDSNEVEIETVRRHDFSRDVKLLDQPAHGACTMIRRENLLAVGGYDESYTCQDGYELWIKFTARYKVKNINRPLFYYRQHGENLTGNEKHILETRMSIKKEFIKKQELILPNTLAIVPVRNTWINGTQLALVEISGKSILQMKIEALLNVRAIGQIVIASEDESIGAYINKLFPESAKLHFFHRSPRSARLNATLVPTILEVLQSEKYIDSEFELVMTTAIEYPFVGSDIFNDAINTLTIFNSDSLVSVRPESSLFFQHHGSGMVPILGQDKFTKLEREALYRSVGGVMLSRVKGLFDFETILHGSVGHVVLDKKASMEIQTPLDLVITKSIADQ